MGFGMEWCSQFGIVVGMCTALCCVCGRIDLELVVEVYSEEVGKEGGRIGRR